jgi:short-subunit dehydrogenase
MEPRAIVLTGASSGIGAALAGRLARPGRRLLLVARGPERLERVAETVAAQGAEAEIASIDVGDGEAMAARLAAFDARRPVDLVIANAGQSSGRRPDGSPEGAAAARRLIRTNLLGTVNTVEPLLPAMRARRDGRIALISSLAALSPLPSMPAYGASKAGIRAYGSALRAALAPDGVSVTVICPGFVTSPMSRRHLGAKPFEMPADRAASLILRAIAGRRRLASFPRPLAWLGWMHRLLPPALADRAIGLFDADILSDGEEPRG